MNRGVVSFKTLADFLVDPKNPLRFIGGRIIANVRTGFLEQVMIKYSRGLPLPVPKINVQLLGPLLRLNQAAARGFLEDRIVDLYTEIQTCLGSYVSGCQSALGKDSLGDLIPESVITALFYPGLKYLQPVKLVDLDTLSFEDLVARIDKLEQLVRDFKFYSISVPRRLVLEDSFKLLRIIMKSRRKGSLSFEITR